MASTVRALACARCVKRESSFLSLGKRALDATAPAASAPAAAPAPREDDEDAPDVLRLLSLVLALGLALVLVLPSLLGRRAESALDDDVVPTIDMEGPAVQLVVASDAVAHEDTDAERMPSCADAGSADTT